MTDIRSRELAANGLEFAIDEAGEGPDVALFLHGFPEARATWRRQLPYLADLGWRAVAPDLRGYGDSSRPALQADYLIDRLVEDVEGLFQSLGARRRLLIGHDWGGVIAWQAALSGRVRLDGLVILNAPHPTVFQRVLNSGWRQRLRSWYVAFFLLPGLPEWQLTAGGARAIGRALEGVSPDLIALYRRNIAQPGAATAMLNYYRANALTLSAQTAPTRPLATPTLMIWGEDDVALDVALTQGNEAFVSDFTLVRLPGVSHWVQQEAPDRVNQAIGDWLARLNPAAPS
jgi:pimeloyl-ACP methyl ester carboxylesterase